MKSFLLTTLFLCYLPLWVISQYVTAAGSLNTGRHGHEIQKLNNGKVLVFGGASLIGTVTQFYASCELYNETSNSWTATGNMKIPRADFTSVVLADGSVLAIGGSTTYESSSCEIYNPTTGQWAFTDSMKTPRGWAIAKLLSNGKVLVVGTDDTYELYDPTTSQWTYKGTMNHNHSRNSSLGDGFDMIALPNNKVYVISPEMSEIYDVTANSWTTNVPTIPGVESMYAVLLNNTTVMITGDSTSGSLYNKHSILYDITSNTLNLGSLSLVSSTHYHTELTKAANGNVFTFGYRGFGFANDFIKVYNKNDNKWYDIGTIPFTINGAYDYRAILLNNNKILVTGGQVTLSGQKGCYLVDANNVSVDMKPPTLWDDTISLYPNPSNGVINLSIQSNHQILESYQIYDILGKKIADTKLDNPNITFETLCIENEGQYSIILHFTNGTIVKKVSVIK